MPGPGSVAATTRCTTRPPSVASDHRSPRVRPTKSSAIRFATVSVATRYVDATARRRRAARARVGARGAAAADGQRAAVHAHRTGGARDDVRAPVDRDERERRAREPRVGERAAATPVAPICTVSAPRAAGAASP